jgi:error-prone DNA polymerase
MGFYAPAQIVQDARESGVEIRPIDVNHSFWDHTLEPAQPGWPARQGRVPFALRLGFRQAEGIREAEARRLVARRDRGFLRIDELVVRAELRARPMRALADADAFGSLGLDRRAALWEVRRLPEHDPLPLFAASRISEFGEEPDADLVPMPLGEAVATDYQTMRLSLKAHPMALLRPFLAGLRVSTAIEAAARASGRFARVAGLVLVRQRPGKGNAIFLTLEDETGIVNCVLWAREFERQRAAVMGARLMLAEGRIQKSPEGVVHLMTSRVSNRSELLEKLWEYPEEHYPRDRHPRHSHPRNARILPASRDFR